MLELRRRKQLSFLIQILQDLRIRFFHEESRVRSLLCHISFAIYKLHEGQLIFSADTGVILTEGRSDMNDSGTV